MTQTFDYQSPIDQPRHGGLSVASLVLGIVGCVFAISFCVTWLGMALGLIGAILGAVAWAGPGRDVRQKKGMAVAGTILSIAAIVVGTIVYVAFFVFIGRAGGGFQSLAYKGQLVQQSETVAQREADNAIAAGASAQAVNGLRASVSAELSALIMSQESAEQAKAKADAALEAYRAKVLALIPGATTTAPVDDTTRPVPRQ